MLPAVAVAAWAVVMRASADTRALLGIQVGRSVARILVRTSGRAWARISVLIQVRASDQGQGSWGVAVVSAMDDSVSGIAALGVSGIHITATMPGLIRTGGGIRIRQTMQISANWQTR